MTINQLHKKTAALIAKGHGRKTVCVDKSKITHPLDGEGCCIIPVTSAEISTHEMMDENGGWKELANGKTAQRTALVLTAEC